MLIIENPKAGCYPEGFLDDDPGRRGMRIDGVPVLGTIDEVGPVARSREVFVRCRGGPEGARRVQHRAEERSLAPRALAPRRVASPRRGFYVIVPPEHWAVGCPSPEWFIDDLMAYLGRPYYVGLLAAAALHGGLTRRRRSSRSSPIA